MSDDDYCAPPCGEPPLAGCCPAFCPPAEAAERIGNRYLSSCETGPGRQLVKRYSRSAAGVSFDAMTLRPLPVLRRAVAYLLGDVLPHSGVAAAYGFISDRLRAVRQDAAVQQLCSAGLLRLLVASARYHVLAYRVAAGGSPAGAADAAAAAAAAPLGGSGDEGDRLDPVMNDSRLLECVAHGLGVCEQQLLLLRSQPPGDAPLGDDAGEELLAQHAELLAYRLGASFLEPASVLAALRTLARTRAAQLQRAPVAAVLAVFCAWHARDWCGTLRLIDALGAGWEAAAAPTPDARAQRPAPPPLPPGVAALLWGLLQRYVPLARLRLLAALADALPARFGVPIDAVVQLLQFRDAASAAAPPTTSGGGERAWEAAARFCLQLRQRVLHQPPAGAPLHPSTPAAGEGGGGTPVSAQLLGELHRAAAASALRGEPFDPRLEVHFDRAADLGVRSTDPRVRAALAPTREAPPPRLRFPATAAELAALAMEALGE